MSFKCKGCNQTATKQHKKVIKTRTHKHQQTFRDDYGNPVLVNTGEGTQIVEEAAVCGNCAGK
jgi:hypothetical protein